MNQGASSAYGAVGRQRRADLELHELLTLCSKIEKHEERVAAVKHYGTVYPEFRNFLIVAYFCKDAFSDITDMGPFTWIKSKVAKGASEENLASLWREVTRMYNTFPAGPKAKRGRAQRILNTIYPDDSDHIYNLIFGNFYSKEINELVVKEAFPELAPKA